VVVGGAYPAGQPVVIVGPTTAVYNSLETRRDVPQVEAVSRERTLVWVASLDLYFR
jgi:hypothetical protein